MSPSVLRTSHLDPVLETASFVQPSLFSPNLISKPLEYTGAIDAYERIELTPALGDQFSPEVRLKEILALPKEEGDAVLRDLAILLSWRGVLFFKDQHDLGALFSWVSWFRRFLKKRVS
jgi:hypothetical protein